ncbi:MAG: hypothetical protein AB1755_04415 [Candidatus Omnitrophota bacterium]
MYKKILFIIAMVIIPSLALQSYAKEITKDEAIKIASDRLLLDGLSLEGVEVTYDEENKLWESKINKIIVLDNIAIFGIIKKGFLENYKIVFFQFKPPHRDIWVFIDKDTGDILDIYKR